MSRLLHPHDWSMPDRESRLVALKTALFCLLWAVLVALSAVLAYGIHVHEEVQEARRLESVHQAGMAVGAALCRASRTP